MSPEICKGKCVEMFLGIPPGIYQEFFTKTCPGTLSEIFKDFQEIHQESLYNILLELSLGVQE